MVEAENKVWEEEKMERMEGENDEEEKEQGVQEEWEGKGGVELYKVVQVEE